MNWSDLLVLCIIVGFGAIGLMNGFVYSIFRLVSFLVSIVVSFKFYPVVAEFLMKTNFYVSVKGSILKNLVLQKAMFLPKASSQAKDAAADAVISQMHLPSFLKSSITAKMPDPSKLIDIDKILDLASTELAKIVINIVSLVLLYILIRIALIFVRFILQGIAKLPVFKQMDKLGGFAFGAVEGLLTIYILCAVLMLFNSTPQFRPVFESIDNSVAANFFYQNNFIINLMFPK